MQIQFPKVLVVDDCNIIRQRLAKELCALGYQVVAATDGVEALAYLEAEQFDFVLTDWDMPNLDGARLCHCIRASPSPHYIYVIMMTGHTNTMDVVAGMNAGADDFVKKPVDVRELEARLMNGGRILAMARALTDEATRDPLTGVLNRRTFNNSINSAIQMASRQGCKLSAAMVDIDHFKEVNDNHGHIVGDRALVAVATLLRNSFRDNDLIYRYGGEEFAVILQGADEAAGVFCMERCRKGIEGIELVGAPGVKINVSCGVSEVDRQNISAVELIERADMALRVAKKRGRNRTVAFSELEAASSETVAIDGSSTVAFETTNCDQEKDQVIRS